jgi:hypothetical protein
LSFFQHASYSSSSGKAHTNKQKVSSLSFFKILKFVFDYFYLNVSVDPEAEANSFPEVLHLALLSVVLVK